MVHEAARALTLVELLGFDTVEAAEIAEVRPDALRQRLTRARLRLGDFVAARCGVVNEAAACRCEKQVAAKCKRPGAPPPRFAALAGEDLGEPDTVAAAAEELRAVRELGAAFHAGGRLQAPSTLRARMQALLPIVLG